MQSWCYTARWANRSRTLWSAVKKVILQNSLWILYLIPYELNLPVSLTFCWHTKHMTEKLMTELGPKKKQKQIPLYGTIHWCPHPLLQHFCFLGQSLSWEHISAHTPDTATSTLFFGHTPGFADIQSTWHTTATFSPSPWNISSLNQCVACGFFAIMSN